MNLTDEQIIKSLECCNKPIGQAECTKCSYFETKNSCTEKLINDTLDLINRLKAENEALINGQETLQKHLAEKNAEIEKNENIIRLADKTIETANAEIERLKESLRKQQEETSRIIQSYVEDNFN